VQREVSSARQAAKSGKTDDATRAYQAAIASSPDSAFLYRELAAIERGAGNNDAALGHYRQANALEPDAASLVAMAELLAGRDEYALALQAYDDALAIDADPKVEEARNAIREKAEYAKLPAEFRAIEQATQINRADLAALIGQRLEPLLAVTRPRDIGVITDIRGHWAERWILSVARAGVMDAYDNHTFQPRGVVRRVDFAQAVTRLLAKVAVVAPAEARRWRDARGRFTDIGASHLAYPAASAAIASGVMSASADGAFEPSRFVTGAEAIEAFGRLSAMIAGTRAASEPR
jgi:tetratricopeptide (TPR) repeat protein